MNVENEATPARETVMGRKDVMAIMVGLMLAMLLGALDQTIVATAMPTIGRDLGDEINLPWIVTAYLLAAVAVTPLYGKLSDIYGRRIIMLIAIATFVIGSIACALAPSMLFLALARGIQGAGGGGLISLAQTIIADVVSPRERGRYQVHIASVFATSSLAGPVLGGFLAEHVHWSAIFWINIPLGFLAFFMVDKRLAALPKPGRNHRLDILGAVLLVIASTSLLLALSWGGAHYGWTSPKVIALAAAAITFGGLFVWRIATAEEPLIPLTVLADPVVKTATLSAGIAMGTFVGLTIFMPIYLETVIGLTASQSGVALIPLMIGTVTGSTIAGRLMVRIEHYKRPPLVGLAVAFCCTSLLAWKPAGLPFPLLELVLAATSIGIGTCLPTATVSIQNAVARHHLGTATATSNFFRQIGGALIVAVFGTMVFGSAGHGGEFVPGQAVTGADAVALVSAFRHVFMGAAICVLSAFLLFAAMPERPLRGKEDVKPEIAAAPSQQPGE